MVTHDISLKYFADRVLWMRDGKLQRVEVVPAQRRAEAHAQLQRDVAALKGGAGSGGAEPAAAAGVSFANTQVRRPRDYECLRGMEVSPRMGIG